MSPEKTPFNPLDKRALAESIVRELMSRRMVPLNTVSRFTGAGVYCLYYLGDFEPYAPIRLQHPGDSGAIPIYVGRAIPKGGRKGTEPDPNEVLWRRLMEHKRSIEQARNLQASDFLCRWLLVDDLWIPLAERLLIRRYQPLWNVVVDGFGIHDPGRGRRLQRRSAWDVLHPGRPFAEHLPPPGEEEQATVLERIRRHLANH